MRTIASRTGWLIVLVVMGLWAHRDAEACTCLGRPQPCEAVWQSGAVFLGRVVAIDEARGPSGSDGALAFLEDRRVTLELIQLFRGGLVGPHVEIFTGQGDSDCGYDFHVGTEYLVYTHERRQGEPLKAGLCTLTKPASEAEGDLNYLRALQSSPDALTGRVFGTVFFRDDDVDGQQSREYALPAGLRVRLTASDGVVRWTAMDADGKFEFTGLEAGTYQLDVDLADVRAASDGPHEIELPSRQACASVPIRIFHDGERALTAVWASARSSAHAASCRLARIDERLWRAMIQARLVRA